MPIKLNGSTSGSVVLSAPAEGGTEVPLALPGTAGTLANQTQLGRRNFLINGDFDVWQRSSTQTSSGYGSCDRWFNAVSGSTQSISLQTFTLGQTDVPDNPKYFFRNVVTTGSGAAHSTRMYQGIELVHTLAGETATLSFYAKADAAKTIGIEIMQYFGSGGSSQVNTHIDTITINDTWAKYSVTFDVPSISTKTITAGNALYVQFWLDAGSDNNSRSGSIGNQSGTFDFSHIQLEKGSEATAFDKRTLAEELNACHRYYQVFSSGLHGYAESATTIDIVANPLVQFYDVPSLVLTDTSVAIRAGASNRTSSGSSITYDSVTNGRAISLRIDGFTGMTAGEGVVVQQIGTVLTAEAEL